MKYLLLKLIEYYQKFFSPDHSAWGRARHPNGYCKYYPTCSEYCRQAIERRGAILGVMIGAWRVLRCNPFSEGGIDYV